MWEITGAEFSKAEAHTADGISIRFPRCTRIRDDKDWKTATNLQQLKVSYCRVFEDRFWQQTGSDRTDWGEGVCCHVPWQDVTVPFTGGSGCLVGYFDVNLALSRLSSCCALSGRAVLAAGGTSSCTSLHGEEFPPPKR